MRDASTLAAAMQLGVGLAIVGATMALRAGDAVAGGGQSAVTVALCVLVLIAVACAAGALRLDQAAAREVPAERGAHGVVTKHDAAGLIKGGTGRRPSRPVFSQDQCPACCRSEMTGIISRSARKRERSAALRQYRWAGLPGDRRR